MASRRLAAKPEKSVEEGGRLGENPSLASNATTLKTRPTAFSLSALPGIKTSYNDPESRTAVGSVPIGDDTKYIYVGHSNVGISR